MNKTLKKGKTELTESEIQELNKLFKDDFPSCKFVVPHSLYGQWSEKNKKKTILVQDSRFPNGFIQIKKKNPSLKQIIQQLNVVFTDQMINETKVVDTLVFTNINDTVDVLTINWTK